MERINEADKLFEAKVLDKIRIAKTKNQITNTDFLSLHEQNISKKILNIEKETNFLFYLPCSGLEKAMLIVYPEKCGNIFEDNISERNITSQELSLPKVKKDLESIVLIFFTQKVVSLPDET